MLRYIYEIFHLDVIKIHNDVVKVIDKIDNINNTDKSIILDMNMKIVDINSNIYKFGNIKIYLIEKWLNKILNFN